MANYLNPNRGWEVLIFPDGPNMLFFLKKKEWDEYATMEVDECFGNLREIMDQIWAEKNLS